MPNLNLGFLVVGALAMTPAWAADTSTDAGIRVCENALNCLVEQCTSHGGYPTCITNRLLVNECAQAAYKQSVDTDWFESNEAMVNWIIILLYGPSGYLYQEFLSARMTANVNITTMCQEAIVAYDLCHTDAAPGNMCPTDAWVSAGYGAETSNGSFNACGACLTTKFRCTAGFYGVPIAPSGRCIACPTLDNASARSNSGTTSISGCFIPTSETLTDDTGTYKFTTDCYYTF